MRPRSIFEDISKKKDDVYVAGALRKVQGVLRKSSTLHFVCNGRDDSKRSDQFKDPNPGESKTEVSEPEPSDEEFRIRKNAP